LKLLTARSVGHRPGKPIIQNIALMLNKKPVILLLMVIACMSCHRNPFNVDIKGMKADITVSRFEQALFTADPSKIDTLLPLWKKEFGIFLQHFSYTVRLGNINNPEFAEQLKLFVTDRTNYEIYQRTQAVFPDLDTFSTALNNAFGHYRYYFPDKPIPRVITYISGLNQSAITDDSLLAIGLDKYLGPGEKIYAAIGIYNYLLPNMRPEKLVSDCMLFWAETEFPYNDSINNLVASMIYRGKLLYFVSAMVPDQPDSLKWGFTGKGLDFCIAHEKPMWATLIENKFLFSTDRFTIDKFILEGPFTKDFGRESPGRAAVWIGLRIVSAYMEKNPDITLQQLMDDADYMKILNLSTYNP
jgi:hypothetical protein